LAVGYSWACAILADTTVKCWGDNLGWQLGDGTMQYRTSPETLTHYDPFAELVPLSGVVAVSAGYYHGCAVLADGSAQCWGDNDYGQEGDGTHILSTRPGAVSGLAGMRDISASQFDTCAVVAGGRAYCWGINSDGELGDGMTGGISLLPLPVQVDW
jgi:alpha-tubulin suppressor-like RCC1 family protein